MYMMVNAEQKTLNYLETNLASVDRSATSNLGMLESDSNSPLLMGANRPVDGEANWLFCMKRYGNTIRKLSSIIIGIPLVALVYVVVSSALTPPNAPAVITYHCQNLQLYLFNITSFMQYKKLQY